MDQEKPNYYAIIPAEIRYDTKINSTEKLLYAEITALSNKEGICWASNNYFAKLYNVTPIYVSNMINKLKKLGYIKTEYIYKPNTREIKQRNIYLLNNSLIPTKQKFNRGIKQKFKDNNININNINNNKVKNFKNNILKEDLDTLYDN